MSVFTIATPKPPEDVWAIEVDFADRLDTSNGEEISSVAVEAYRLWDYGQVLFETSLDGATRLNLEIEKTGGVVDRVSFPLTNEPSCQLRIPSIYSAEIDTSVVDLSSITIGPATGSPPNTKVSFHIQNGIDNTRYAVLVTATTNKGRQHSCVIRFQVLSLSLAD